MRLEGKAAIVTGAGRGIGAAIAEGFAKEGCAVVVNDLPSSATIERVARKIRDAGGRAMAVCADVAKLSDHEKLVQEALAEFGRLDILVNNAGVQFRESFLEAKAETWDATFSVNLRGAYFLSQKAARVMATTGGGKILNISSVHEETPHLHNSIYTITKGGVRLMTKCLALELADYRINVNGLAPGAILTDINRHVLADETFRASLLSKIPLKRVGEPVDLVGAAVFLVSQEADYITGTTLFVDGGLLLLT